MTDFTLGGDHRLPSGWSHAVAGDFRRKRSVTFNPAKAAETRYELYSVPSYANREPEVIPVAEIGSNKQFVSSGDVLVSRINPRLNRTWVVGEWRGHEQIASTEWAVFPRSDAVEPRYLAILLSDLRLRDFLTANSSGVGGSLTRVRPNLFDEIRIPIPPTSEQRRIVEKIEALFDEIDGGVESLQAAKSTLDLYRKSLLKSAFEGRLTADWRARNPDKLETPEALIARIRKERESRYRSALGEWEKALAKWRTNGEEGKKPAKPRRPAVFKLSGKSGRAPWPIAQVRALIDAPLVNGRSVKGKVGGFPVLRLTALKNGEIDCTEHKEGNWTHEDARPFLVGRDDIFLARGNGSKRLVGIAGRVLGNLKPVAFPDTLIRVQIDRSVVRSDFFVLMWNSQAVRQQIERTARTTAGIYKINQQHVLGFTLPLPGLNEQAEIARLLGYRLDAADVLDTEIDRSLARATLLRQSVLKKAFAGQLVPQNPNDEPAAALLQRVAVEKSSQNPERTKRKVSIA